MKLDDSTVTVQRAYETVTKADSPRVVLIVAIPFHNRRRRRALNNSFGHCRVPIASINAMAFGINVQTNIR